MDHNKSSGTNLLATAEKRYLAGTGRVKRRPNLKYTMKVEPQRIFAAKISREENTKNEKQSPTEEHKETMEMNQTPVFWFAAITNERQFIGIISIALQQPNVILKLTTKKKWNFFAWTVQFYNCVVLITKQF